MHGFHDLGTLKGEANSAGNGINDSGQVVGTSWITKAPHGGNGYGPPKTTENGLLWTAGKMTDLGSNLSPDAINDSGEIISPGSLWDGKTWTSLGTLTFPGGGASIALGLNNDGQVVGYVMNSQGQPAKAYLWSPSRPNGSSGSMISLGSFDTTSAGLSSAAAINGGGSVTGSAENDDLYGGNAHAFIWKPSAPNATTGTMMDLGTLATNPIPGYSRSEGLAINSGGVVVGDSNPAGSTGQTDAAIWQPGAGGKYTLSDLNSLIPSGTGWVLIKAEAINDSGLIVALGQQNGGPLHDLLLTPQTAATAMATASTASVVIHPTAAASSASVGVSAVASDGPGFGGQSGPASTTDRAASPPADLPVFDFALADLVARPRPKSLLNDGVARTDVGGCRHLLTTGRIPGDRSRRGRAGRSPMASAMTQPMPRPGRISPGKSQ